MIDIRTPELDLLAVDELRAALLSAGEFAEVHELRRGQIHLRISPEAPPLTHMEGNEVFGVRAVTSDGLHVVQFRTDGFTFSRLPPYPDWGEFFNDGQTYARKFLDAARPPYAERLALRYINHFRLPYPSDLSEYFVALPEVPDALPQYFSNLLSRYTLHDPETDLSAQVTLAVLDDPDPEAIGVLLDIDAFRTAEFPVEWNALREVFERLCVFKDLIFFELISDKNAEAHE